MLAVAGFIVQKKSDETLFAYNNMEKWLN